mgnify:FL=1
MPCREMVMPLAFSAGQRLDLPVDRNHQHLAAYLQQEERVVEALLDARQLTKLGPGTYRYTVTSLQVFQLQVKPVVSLQVHTDKGSLHMRALDCELEGLGVVQDFSLTLDATLICDAHGLSGDARLDVQVSQPPLLKLIPRKALEKTGESLLGGILLGIKTRVGQQLMTDFRAWVRTANPTELSQQASEECATVQNRRA